ncbi:F-box protein At1g78280-like isoform X2 [Acanthaster planci]|uniref:F-box protein At1g78280-like isoform X2 n=1 Tax=Acanthaster planci TaxID=133434 RepID=A0A8B7XP75_ACAPL|nr:F-box protein At1g78280-like isoform X2 [Acanthaster planci]
MRASKRHSKRQVKIDEPTHLHGPATDTQRNSQANSTTNSGGAGHSQPTGVAGAFQRQYYPHWVIIGLIALLLTVGYQRWDLVIGFARELREHPWKFVGRCPSLHQRIPWGATIDRRSNLTLEEFRRVYDAQRPVLITDVLQDWGAMRWDADFFLSQYGKQRVVMKAVEGTLDQAEGFSLPLERFIAHRHQSSPHHWTYVEDELLVPHTAELKKDIGSCVGVTDPYNWTGTNAVIKGVKQWKLYPPGQDEHLYILPDRMSGFPLKSYKYNSPVDAFDPDLNRYPNFVKAEAVEFTQYPGELLIIPTGWFHQAYNTEETIAVSGQVMNRANYRMVLEEIFKAGNVNVESLPSSFSDMAPVDQVRTVMEAIPQSILDEGRRVTELALNQVKSRSHEHTRSTVDV